MLLLWILVHGTGGMMPRYYSKFRGGSTEVDKLVSLGAVQPRDDAQRHRDLGKLRGVLPAVAAVQPAATDPTIARRS